MDPHLQGGRAGQRNLTPGTRSCSCPVLLLITAMGTVCKRQMDRSHGKDGPSQTEQDGFLMDRSWGGSRSSCWGWQNQAASPGTQLKTALRSCEYRSGRAIRRNSNKLLPLQPSHLNTFHCAAVLEKVPPQHLPTTQPRSSQRQPGGT